MSGRRGALGLRLLRGGGRGGRGAVVQQPGFFQQLVQHACHLGAFLPGGAGTRYQNNVITAHPLRRKHGIHRGAYDAAGAVALHGIADLL